MTDKDTESSDYVLPTVAIVTSFVGKNPIQIPDLQGLIQDVHATLVRLQNKKAEAPAEPPKPVVPIKKSVQNDYLICLNDGRKFRSLKRHLKSRYGMTPEDYRAYWGLPADYPMVAPGYARDRSQLAKAMGLGQQRRRKPA